MKFLTLLLALTLNSYAFAQDKACTLVSPGLETEMYKPIPPTVKIFPGTGNEEEVQLEFTIPSLIKGTPDQLKRYKIKDKDGSVNIILLNYLAQNSDPIPADIDTLLLAALAKHRRYWESAAKDKSVDPILVESSLAMNKFFAKEDRKFFTPEERQKLISGVLEPFMDYDENLKFEYKDVENGRYVSRPAKRLKDILPPEFYEVAASTKLGGKLKDRKKPGVDTCEFLPVIGQLPTAGKVEAIKRPGTR